MNSGKSASDAASAAERVSSVAWYRPWISPRSLRFWLVVAFLSYTLAGFFLAPWLIKRTAEKSVSELGRTLTIGQVKVNPFVLSVQVLDAELRDTDEQMLLSFKDHFLNLQLSSLFRWAWTFREIRVVNGYLNFERFGLGDNRIFRLIESLPKSDKPAEPEGDERGLARVIVQQFHTIDGRVEVVDHLREGVYHAEFGPINVNVLNISTLPDQSGQQNVGIAFPGGGSINWSGSLQINPLRSEGSLTLIAKQLSEVNQYLNLTLPFDFAASNGKVSCDYHMEQTGPKSIKFLIDKLKLDLAGIAISEASKDGVGPAPVLTVPSLQITGGSMKWPEKTVALETLQVQSAELDVVRHADHSLNLKALAPVKTATTNSGVAVTAASPAPANTATTKAAWQVEVNQFTLADATVNLTDESITPAGNIALQAVSLDVRAINNSTDTTIPVVLDFSPSGEGQVHFDGKVTVLPEVIAEGTLKVTSISLVSAQPWVSPRANVQIDTGTVSVDGKINHDPQEPASYHGSVRVENFKLTDTRREEQLSGWELLDINRVEFSRADNAIKTSELNLSKPYGRLAIAPDKTTNLKGLKKTPEAKSAVPEVAAEGGEAAKPAEKLAISIDGFKIEDMALDFSDLSLPLPFSAAIRNMDGSISTLATASSEPARVKLEGQVNEFGQARIEGSLNAWSPIEFTDIQMIFRNLEMERITPYTVAFAGWEIDAGRMDLDLDYKVKSGKLIGENEVEIRELVLGDQVENAEGKSLPLRLAVALLTDSNGVIDLGLPVSGDLKDPKFRIGGVVVKAILNLLAKAVTAPFRLLGSLVGVDSEDFGTLAFAPGSSEVSPPDREKLVKMAEAMQQRPELILEVGGVFVAELDRPAIQTQRVDALLEEAISAGERGGDELSNVIRRRATETLFQQAFPETTLESVQAGFLVAGPAEEGKEPEMVLDETAYVEGLRQQLIEHQSVTDEELMQLGEARANAILAILEPAGETGIPVNRGAVAEGEASKSGEVGLELKVDAGSGDEGSG